MEKNIFIIFFLIGILIVGCQIPTGKVIVDNNLKEKYYEIGVIAPLTGEAASYGLAAKEGLDLAADEINRDGGILGKKVKLRYEDSQVDSKKAVTIMNRFVNIDKYDIVIVADGSGPTMAVAPIAEKSKTLMIATLGSTPELREAGDFIFRTIPSDSSQGAEIAKILNDKDIEDIAILYVNDPYGVGIKTIVSENFEGEIVTTEPFNSGETDFKPQLMKIKLKEPDAIVLVVRKELPNVLQRIKELKIKSMLIGSETTKDQELINEAGESAEGFYSVFFSSTTDYVGYRERYKLKYGKNPAAYSDYSYDALITLDEAIENAGSFETGKIKESLYHIDIEGASGIIRFDAYGEITPKPMSLYRVVDGQFALN